MIKGTNRKSSQVPALNSCSERVIVKLSSNITIPYLTQVINNSFEEGIFPDDLKKAIVIPLHKDGSKLDENNHINFSSNCLEHNYKTCSVHSHICLHGT